MTSAMEWPSSVTPAGSGAPARSANVGSISVKSVRQSVTIPAGSYDGTLATAVVINLSINDDALVESNETIALQVSVPAGASNQLSVSDTNVVPAGSVSTT